MAQTHKGCFPLSAFLMMISTTSRWSSTKLCGPYALAIVAFSPSVSSDRIAGTSGELYVTLLMIAWFVPSFIVSNSNSSEIVRVAGMPRDVEGEWRLIGADAPVPLAEVWRTGEGVFLPSRAAWNARYPGFESLLEATGHHANIVVPLEVGHRRLGVMGIAFDSARAFSQHDRMLACAVAAQAAQALGAHRVAHALRAAVQAPREPLARDEEQVLVDRDVALRGGAHVPRGQLRLRRVADVPDLPAVEAALKNIVAGKSQIGVDACEELVRRLGLQDHPQIPYCFRGVEGPAAESDARIRTWGRCGESSGRNRSRGSATLGRTRSYSWGEAKECAPLYGKYNRRQRGRKQRVDHRG